MTAKPITPRQVADTLTAAADHIEEVGWWSKHMPYTGKRAGANCAGFAISDTASSSLVAEAAYVALADHLGLDYADHGTIFDWNDAQPDGTTVIAALRAAAEAQGVAA